MSIRKHKHSAVWWVDISPPGGSRIRRSTGTTDKEQVQEYHDRLKAEMWRVQKLGDRPTRLFEEACILFLKASEGQSDYASKVRHVKYWRSIFARRSICSLTTEEVLNALPTHRTREGQTSRKLKAATRNRYLSSIRRIFSLAEAAGWIDRKPRLSKAKEPSVRVRSITQTDAARLLAAIKLQWVRDACEFALATGCRANEIFSLIWDKVDEPRSLAWVTNDLAKSGKARSIPLNNNALEVIRRREGMHSALVFSRTGDGKQIKQVDRRAFLAALQQAGIKDFRFHDLRHTWASWHVQAGTPLFVLKELGGWETIEMVKKYAHLDAGHLAAHVNNVTFRSKLEPEKEIAA